MITTRKSRSDHAISINPKVVRNINRALILNIIWEQQPISRARIAQVSRLNKSTVSSIIAGLLDEELVLEEADRSQAVGRTPINLRMKTGKHYIGAAYFDSAGTQLAVVDIDGTVKQCTEIPATGEAPEAFIARCLDELCELRKRSHLPRYRGVGVTVAGIVDSQQSRVVFAPNLGWENLDLGGILREHCPDVPIYAVQNDAKASALAELWFGRHELSLFNFVFLSVGRGIGTGLVVDKHVMNGESHAAGEFGHMTIIEGGEPCSCGNRGCWEAYASDRATVQRYVRSKALPPEQTTMLTLGSVIARAATGDDAARNALEMTGYYLGLGIADIVLAFDPEAIVIGGSIIKAWDLIYPKIMETVMTRAFFGRQRNTTILPSALSSSAPILGAAAVAIRKIFTDLRVAV
jgi:N-acetylglucosamine repressor